MKRGQGAIEFVIITTAMMLIFAVAFIAAQSTYVGVQQERLENQVYDFFTTIEIELKAAQQAGQGYERDIRIPKTFSGIPFVIELRLNESSTSTDELVLNISNQEFVHFLQTPVNGTLGRDMYTLYGGNPVEINLTSTS
jgi:hypothetical protein